jgi:hypothetical protein
MAEDDGARDISPLVQRVDALLRSHRGDGQRGDADVPVLTDIVDLTPERDQQFDPKAVEALALELERAVLARLGEELDRVIEERLARFLAELLDGARADLTASVRQMVRDSVSAAVSAALGRDTEPPAQAPGSRVPKR